MARIGRLKSITMSRIEAFLASLERPEDILPQLAKEMAEKVKLAASAEAKALTAVKADRRRLDAAAGRIERLRKGAVLALQADDIKTARQAIAAQIKTEQELEACGRSLNLSESAHRSAENARKQLQHNLHELKARKEEILDRARTVGLRQRHSKDLTKLSADSNGSILDLVTRMETKLEETEAEIEVRSEIARTLGSTFSHERVMELEYDAEVDRRLAQLRKRLKEDAQHGQA
ncbi:MAG: PspA/IM30 family protein [Planctomycetota bacterium]